MWEEPTFKSFWNVWCNLRAEKASRTLTASSNTFSGRSSVVSRPKLKTQQSCCVRNTILEQHGWLWNLKKTPQWMFSWGLKLLKSGAVGEAVGQDDVLVEVICACGAVTFDLIDHLTDGEDGGGGQVGFYLRGRGRWGDALRNALVGVAFICVAVPLGERVECGFGFGRPVGGAGAEGAGRQRLAQVVWAHLLRVVGGCLTPVWVVREPELAAAEVPPPLLLHIFFQSTVEDKYEETL